MYSTLPAFVSALFLGFGGAFHSEVVPIPERLVYWLMLMVLDWLWGAFVSRWFQQANPNYLAAQERA